MLKFECRRSEKGGWTIAMKRAQFLGCSADRTQTSVELKGITNCGQNVLTLGGRLVRGAVFCGFKLFHEKYATHVHHDT